MEPCANGRRADQPGSVLYDIYSRLPQRQNYRVCDEVPCDRKSNAVVLSEGQDP